MENELWLTAKGACKRKAGVMWNLSSSTLHIQWVHGEHVLGKKRHSYKCVN